MLAVCDRVKLDEVCVHSTVMSHSCTGMGEIHSHHLESSLDLHTHMYASVCTNASLPIPFFCNHFSTSLQALKEMQPETARVIRGGRVIPELPARDLLPGDVIELRAGDRVPADTRITALRSGTVRLMQASLTGESEPVLKQTEAGEVEEVEVQGKECMAFAGTTVSNGSCVGVVTGIGMGTEIGKIQAQIAEASLADYDTPLTRKLDEFSELLTKVVGGVCVLVWVINYKYFIHLEWEGGLLPSKVEVDFGQATYYFKVRSAEGWMWRDRIDHLSGVVANSA